MECEFILKITRNAKLEVFLQRILSVEDYAAIRTYSPCVVQSSIEKLTFRHAVLTDDKILLTQHPPRTIYCLTDMADVVSIKKVDELPYFLQGKEQKNCQHVKLICRSRVKNKFRSRRTASDLTIDADKTAISTMRKKLRRRNKSDSTQNNSSTSSLIIAQLDSKNSSKQNSTESLPTTPKFNSSESWRIFDPAIHPRKAQSVIGQYNCDIDVDLSPIRSKSTSYVEPLRKTTFDLFPESTTEFVDDEKEELEEINLYILNPRSFFISVLYSVWDNYLICATLRMEDDDDDDVFTRQLTPQKSELVEKLFKQLSSELIEKLGNHDESFHLLQELKSSFKKHVIFRRLFWKDLKLIKYLVEQLQKYLTPSNCDKTALHDREDELELAVLILSTFCLSFRDEQTLLARCLQLSANGNELFEELVKTCVITAQMPNDFLNTTRRMLSSFSQFKTNAWRNLPEAELIELTSEITNQQVQLLYHLFFAYDQMLSAQCVIKATASACAVISDLCDQFLPRFMTQFLTLVSCPQQFRPFQVTLLYRYFNVINILFSNCERVRSFVLNSFSEEFRYYINCQSITARISNSCPLKQRTKNLIRDVVENINDCVILKSFSQ